MPATMPASTNVLCPSANNNYAAEGGPGAILGLQQEDSSGVCPTGKNSRDHSTEKTSFTAAVLSICRNTDSRKLISDATFPVSRPYHNHQMMKKYV
ncbi:hypothetical protein TNCT_532601 [Trichonephila clavata]|uniref:Uncharacterized protein n=1 Tax=Trichonephila clavata TaxID=2740835 RepID=A0A8X6GAF5_TRICU|nr:hypothetical protein TNCT_532601 [Trichonephila clavata]